MAKIWYVGGCKSLTIWWLCQFLVPPENQKSRLLFDRTYHFNNTWEGEYSIKNYPAMQFWQKFGMSQGVHLWQSDDCASFYYHQETSNPGYYLIEPTILTTPGKENTQEKITQPCDFGKNLVCWRMYISDNLMTLSIHSGTWKPEIQAVIWQNLPFKQHLARRILDKKLPSQTILSKIWYVTGCTSLTI